MSAYLSLEVDASDIISGMLEDGNFAAEMWQALAIALDDGALRDDLVDILNSHPDKERAEGIRAIFLQAFQKD